MSAPTVNAPTINAERLMASLRELAKVGSFWDDSCDRAGVNRLALSDADGEARRLVKGWFEDAGLDIRVDPIGNTFGRRAGSAPELAPVMSGSHIDSVPSGGAFDGALGVLSALEAVRSLNDASIVTRRPIEIAFFTDEEGARFGTDMLGSATACGRIPVEQAYRLCDRDGKTVRQELERIGFLGAGEVRLSPPHAYLEVHIEQGPLLARANVHLGLVTGVQGISWRELTIVGRPAHAGTTPMNLRRDAGLGAAKINLAIHEMTQSNRFGALRATMGRFDASPNQVNVVMGRVRCTIDLRNPDDAALEAAEAALDDIVEGVGRELDLEISSRQTARTASVRFSPEVLQALDRSLETRALTYQRIVSGAGHDAQELAALCPAAMLFVPGDHDGISHNPREHSSDEACARGAQALLDGLLALADD